MSAGKDAEKLAAVFHLDHFAFTALETFTLFLCERRTWGLVVSSGYQLLRNYESCRLDGGFVESVPQLSQVQVLMPRLHNTRGEVCYSSCPSSPLPLDCECVADLVSNRPGN